MSRNTTFFLVLVLMATSVFAQSTLTIQKSQKVSESQQLVKQSPVQNFRNPVALQSGSQLFFTDYDYAANNSIPKMLEMYDFDGDGTKDVFAVGMVRIDGGTRGNNLAIGVGGEFTTSLLSDPAVYSGWGTMQIAQAGPQANKVLVMGHAGGNTTQMNFDLATFLPEAPDSVIGGNFPDFVYLDDGTYFVTNANGAFFKSTDNLETVEQIGWFDLDDPTVTDWNSEYLLKKSPNGQNLFHFTMHQRNGGANGGPGGADADSTDVVVINYSNDAGANWTLGEIIGRDGVSEVVNRPDYYPIFENFGQINGVVDNNGVMHVTVNGYSFWDNGTDTTEAFPALYWNSADRNWIAISDEVVEQSIYADTNVVYARPGNGLGNAYPIPSVSEDGQRIVVMWQGPEYAGTPGVGNPNLWTATADNPNVIHYTDLYYATSGDAGKTWSSPMKVDGASAQMVQETFPYLNPVLDVDGDNVTVNYVYMVDAVPGVSLFADNNGASNDSYWVYDEFTVAITDVDEAQALPTSFSLEQNYPNPFNPTTKITYSVPEMSFVSVKVYNVLGSEVATLVNGVQNAGVNTIQFDASNLSTGMYIYTMKTNNFTSSKKMLLIK